MKDVGKSMKIIYTCMWVRKGIANVSSGVRRAEIANSRRDQVQF